MPVPPPPDEYCLLMIQHWSTCMNKTEWAAWGQALLTVCAVLLTYLISQRHFEMDGRRQRNSSRQAGIDRVEDLIGLMAPQREGLSAAWAELAASRMVDEGLHSRLWSHQDLLQQIPLQNLQPLEVQPTATWARQSLDKAMDAYQTFFMIQRDSSIKKPDLIERRQMYERRIADAGAALDELRDWCARERAKME